MLNKISQETFKDLPDEIITIGVNSNGFAYGFGCKKSDLTFNDKGFAVTKPCVIYWIGSGYDTKNWQNSLIERFPYEKISLADLIEKVKKEGTENPIEFFFLTGVFRSNKNIFYDRENKTFSLINEINDTEETFTEEELLDESSYIHRRLNSISDCLYLY